MRNKREGRKKKWKKRECFLLKIQKGGPNFIRERWHERTIGWKKQEGERERERMGLL